MNLQEMVWRFNQKALQKYEYYKYYNAHQKSFEIPIEYKTLKPNGERLGINFRNSKYCFFEKIELFGLYDYDDYKNKWNSGFQTSHEWPDNDFSYKIHISQREDIGDIRTNWELNRHYQFIGLAKNYYISQDKLYLNELKSLFYDWNEKNLYLHGVQWTSAMEIAIRLISWSYTYAFLEQCTENHEEQFLHDLLNGIICMTEYILKHYARFSSANNHLIIEMTGVCVSGCLFNNTQWIEKARDILTKEISVQNYADGVNKEMSLHYQAFIMEAYGLICHLFKVNNIRIPEIWLKYLKRMSEFLSDCCGKHGEVVIFGDNDEGKIIDFSGKMDDYYRYVLQMMGMVLENRYTDHKLCENIMWIFGSVECQKYFEKPLYSSSDYKIYSEGGYTLLRSKDKEVLIGFDHAELGFGSIAAHGHSDALSIQAFYKGRQVLIDPGTYNYHVPKTIRDEIRKTKSHNTVYVPNNEQAQMLGPFLWGKRYTITTVNHDVDEYGIHLSCQIEYEGLIHRRELIFDFDRNLKVIDTIDNNDEAVQIWNCENLIKVNENCVENDLISIEAKYNRADTKDMICSEKYGSKSKCEQVLLYFSDNLETKIKFKT